MGQKQCQASTLRGRSAGAHGSEYTAKQKEGSLGSEENAGRGETETRDGLGLVGAEVVASAATVSYPSSWAWEPDMSPTPAK